ncbi:MAG: hypothetical protein JSS89_12040 [Bacteroidetes bacterium]|nr:hypothetical protein [Bacteroidota bacterium]
MNIIGNGGVIAPHPPAAAPSQPVEQPATDNGTLLETSDANVISVDHQVATVLTSEIHLPIRFHFGCTAISLAHLEGKSPAEIEELVRDYYMRVFAAMEKTTSFHLLREVFHQVLTDAYQDVRAQDEQGNLAVQLLLQMDSIAFPKVEPQAGSYYVANQSRLIDPPKPADELLAKLQGTESETTSPTAQSNGDDIANEDPQTSDQLTADGGDAEASTPGESVDATTAPSTGTTSAPEAVN